jgi:membrane protein DedA with SNARE-associated domain
MISGALAWIAKTAIVVIGGTGYFGVWFLMALESMIVPIPAELVMPFAGYLISTGRFTWLGVFLASLMGSLSGSLVSYVAGKLGGNRLIVRMGKYLLLDVSDLKKTEDWFAKKGEKTIFIGRLIPVVRHLISIPAGIGGMNLKKFSIYTAIGASLWNMFLAWLGYVMGQNWPKIRHYTEPVSKVMAVLLVAGFVYFIVHHVRSKNKKVEEELLKP